MLAASFFLIAMITEHRFNFRIKTNRVWLRGLKGNPGGISLLVAEVIDVVFIKNKLHYKVEYESDLIVYIDIETEGKHVELFELDSKIKE